MGSGYPERVRNRLVSAAIDLLDRDGADVIFFVGAGLARYVDDVRTRTGLPVIDPRLAGVLQRMPEVRGPVVVGA